MFNKYWREYPVFLQLILLILMVFTMLSAASVLALVLTPMITGLEANQLVTITKDSGSKIINASRLMQLIVNITTFCGAAFLYAYASHPKPTEYLGFRKIKSPALVLMAFVLTVAMIPLIVQIAFWLRQTNISAYANEMQERTDKLMTAYMKMDSVPEFLFTFFVFAVVPAFCEEMFFRGVLMRFVHKQTKNLNFAIFMSAAIFALFHGQPYNMISILIMGMVLGYVYYFTGSLWVNIIVHLAHNGIQVVMAYWATTGIIAKDAAEQESFPWYVLIVAVALAVAMFYMMKKKATPLPAGWSSDFTLEELDERAQEKNNLQ